MTSSLIPQVLLFAVLYCFSPVLVADDPLSGFKPFECGKLKPIDCFYPAVCAYRGEPKEQCVGEIGDCSPERCWDEEYECVEGQFCFEKGLATPSPPKPVQSCGLPMINNAMNSGLSLAMKAHVAERILNGTPTAPAKWPWSVSLAGKINKTHYFHHCGGSIVTERYLLTAAHCVCLRLTAEGCIKESRPHEFLVFSNLSDYMGGTIRPEWIERRIEKIYVYPQAALNPLSFGNDIALLRITEPYVFGRLTQPICLSNSVVDEEGKEVTIIGYSNDKEPDKDDSGNGILREAKTALIRYGNCKRNITDYFGSNTLLTRRDSICTLGHTPPNKHSCSIITVNGTCLRYGQIYSGDSGSPIQVQMNGRWTQLGVARWDSHLRAPSVKKGTVLPDVFARISSFCGWMQEVSDGEVQCMPLAG